MPHENIREENYNERVERIFSSIFTEDTPNAFRPGIRREAETKALLEMLDEMHFMLRTIFNKTVKEDANDDV